VDTVLPGGGAVLPINARGLGSGELPCTVRLRDDAGHLVTWSGTVGVVAPPAVRIIHTGNGAYSALPDSSVPAWAIALMVIGALILAALVRLLVLYRGSERVR
jgi:TRAP-type C4-dicarboxylate transport system permease large subunit